MLFEEDIYEKDESPLDDTTIATMILYFSKEEMAEFKQLAKELMMRSGADLSKINLSDFLLALLKKQI